MRRGLQTLKRELNYNASRFAQMLGSLGGVGTAKRLLREDRYTEGFTTLWEKGRLEMSVEFFVLLPWYAPLCNDAERERARRRLEDHQFRCRGPIRRSPKSVARLVAVRSPH